MNDAVQHREGVEIADGVHWVGALDPDLRTFDICLHTDHGTTYNSYTVRGRDGVAVIDTVKASHADEFFARLESVADYDEIRAIVLDHLEPDHSGALPELMRRAPQARLYLSPRALGLLNAVLKPADGDPPPSVETVDTGDSLSLGDRTLRFLHTPFLHWPDTQCTYLAEDGVLFSGDIFGSHYCDGRLFDDRVGAFDPEFDDYYRQIMRPFRRPLIAALELMEPLDLTVIAPTHGPVLRDRPRRYLARYRQLAERPRIGADSDGAGPSLVILYASAYGATARMAEAIAAGASDQAGVRVTHHDLSDNEPAALVDLIDGADGLVIGSPTFNGDAVKPVWDLLSSLNTLELAGKIGAAFGSYGWSGEAVRLIEERLRALKLRVPVAGVRVKLVPCDTELVACRAFGHRLAEALTGTTDTGRVIELEELG
ncbi:FprA family A-type flavoprotein [Thioalkalicoccus limnaeus]|uniref:FprA family A-type flavoprotein n=1 Tax=Thioalkalicoccus limnaeus TaxID=120681 RepID=A0ABV4BGT5_9GAMM